MKRFKRIYFVIFPALLAGLCNAGENKNLHKIIETTALSPSIKNAQWGICVKYADSGKPFASLNPSQNLVPASTLKLFVTAAALNVLGEGYRFKTGLYYDGEITDGGILKGNIYIKGGGDPSLGSTLVKDSLPMEELFGAWAGKIKEKGISKIEGSVIGDNLLFEGIPVPGNWAWEDTGNYYAAAADALSINDNLYKLFFAPGKKEGEEARVLRTEPEIPGLRFTNFMKTGPAGSGDNGYIFLSPGQYNAGLRGTVPAGAAEFAIKGAIPEPALFAAQILTAALVKSGVEVRGNPKILSSPAGYEPLKLIAETFSPPLKDIVRVTNKRSFNLYAEMLSRALALKRKKAGSIKEGNESVRGFLNSSGIDTSELKLFDSCGLSRSNLVKAETMADLLVFMAKSTSFEPFRDSLAFPGDPDATGHIKNFGKGTILEKSLRIKSGSLTGIRSYCGYVKNKKGKLLAFAFIINNYSGSPAEVEEIHEKLLIDIANSD